MKAQVNAEVIEAFEINNIANDVYQHNFHHRPYQVSFFFSLRIVCDLKCMFVHL
jgi:hypothetical protein